MPISHADEQEEKDTRENEYSQRRYISYPFSLLEFIHKESGSEKEGGDALEDLRIEGEIIFQELIEKTSD